MKPSSPKCNAVLLIDNNEIDNFINTRILENFAFTNIVYSHTTAKSALEFLKNIESLNEPLALLIPDYILLDLNMPLMDGFHFLEEFEKFSLTFKSGIKIIVLTCSVNSDDLNRAKKHKSVVEYFNKPLSERDIQKIQK